MNAPPLAIALLSATVLALSFAAPGQAASLDAAAQAAAETSPLSPESSMQEKVKVALMSDPALRGARIAISTRDGQVTLAGVVVNEDQRHRAQQVVASIDGVRKVDNSLEVLPNE